MRNSTSPGMTRMPSVTLRSSTMPVRGADQVKLSGYLAGALDFLSELVVNRQRFSSRWRAPAVRLTCPRN